MSWSLNVIGTPDKIVEHLDKMSGELNGQSKEEFDEAKPHLVSLISANVNKKYGPAVVQLNANGHATFETKVNENNETVKECTYSSCQVELKNLGANLLV